MFLKYATFFALIAGCAQATQVDRYVTVGSDTSFFTALTATTASITVANACPAGSIIKVSINCGTEADVVAVTVDSQVVTHTCATDGTDVVRYVPVKVAKTAGSTSTVSLTLTDAGSQADGNNGQTSVTGGCIQVSQSTPDGEICYTQTLNSATLTTTARTLPDTQYGTCWATSSIPTTGSSAWTVTGTVAYSVKNAAGTEIDSNAATNLLPYPIEYNFNAFADAGNLALLLGTATLTPTLASSPNGDVTISCACASRYSSSTTTSSSNCNEDEPCFSSETTVDVLGQGPTTMVDLKAGDMVRTHTGDFEAVLGFTHHAPNTMGEFKQIFMENAEKPLEMTGNHLVYKSGESAPVAASSLTVGDRLVTSSGDAAITKIDTIMRQGLYTPMTASGDVVVDGVKASNYVQLQDNGSNYATFANGMSTGISQHQGIHMFAAPFRMLCQNGFSSVCNSYNEKGYLSWVDSGIKLAKFANEQSFSVQIAMLMLALLVFAPIYGIELVGLPAVAALAMGAAVWRSSGLSFRVSKAKTA